MLNITTDTRNVSAKLGLRTRPILDAQKLAAPSGEGLARDLAQVISEPIFDIPRLVEAARHQRLDPLLSGRSPERDVDPGLGTSGRLHMSPSNRRLRARKVQVGYQDESTVQPR